MIRLLLLTLIATPALCDPCNAPLPKPGTVFSGRVAYAGDGDSICLTSPAGLIEVRLADFYAPELHEPGGREAKALTSRLLMGRRLTCVAGRRSYDRVVGSCSLNGRPVGDLIRAAGGKEGGRGR